MAKVEVEPKLIDSLRTLLVVLAVTDHQTTEERNPQIEKARQYCEGYLGIKREKLRQLNPADINEILVATGFATEGPIQCSES